MATLTDKRMLMQLDAYSLYEAIIKAIRSRAKAIRTFPRDAGRFMVQLAPQTEWAHEWLESQMCYEDFRDIPEGQRAHNIWYRAVRNEKEVCLQIRESGCVVETMIYLEDSKFMRIKIGVIDGKKRANKLAALAGIKAAQEYFQNINGGKCILRSWDWMKFSSDMIK